MIENEFIKKAIERKSIIVVSKNKLQRINYVTMSRDIVVQLILLLVFH